MSTFEKISPDDPRLTAFALDEMEPTERAAFEQLLQHDAAARALVAEIGGAAHSIGAALAREPVPKVVPIPTQPGLLEIDREYARPRGGAAQLLRFPHLYFTISGLAAACFAIGFVVWQAGQTPTRQVHYTEVDLTKFAPVETAKAKEAVALAATEKPVVEVGLVPEPKEQTGEKMALAEIKREAAGSVVAAAMPAAPVAETETGGARYLGALRLDSRNPGKDSVKVAQRSRFQLRDAADSDRLSDNAFLAVKNEPRSTFSVEVDTKGYTNVRRLVEGGQLPPADAVCIEELVNFFPYRYAPPEADAPVRIGGGPSQAVPFAAHLEVASAPWEPAHRLVRIGLKGREARPVSGERSGETRVAIAKDVKLQVEFNPAQVQAYRLIGYENRLPRKEDINSDKFAAGEVDAGHTVTALYEVVPTGVEWKPASSMEGLKYHATPGPVERADESKAIMSDELLTLKMHYTEPEGGAGKALDFPLRESGRSFEEASADFKFAASVAAFGMILRDSPHKGQATYAKVTAWAQAGLADDVGGYRAEFIGLVGQAQQLAHN